MIIKDVEWISKVGQEAEVTINLKQLTFKVFSHPFIHKKGDEIFETLHAIDVYNVVSSSNIQSIKMQPSDSSCFIAGVLMDNKIVSVLDDICVEIDAEIPGDITVGDSVEFYCDRLELWCTN